MKKKSKIKPFCYKGYTPYIGTFSKVKVSEKVALKTSPDRSKTVDGTISTSKLLKNRKKFIEKGFPVAEFKGIIIDPKKKRHEKKTLILESLKYLESEDLTKNVGQLYDILENIRKNRVWVDFNLSNIGIDKNSKIKIFDFSHIKFTKALTSKYGKDRYTGAQAFKRAHEGLLSDVRAKFGTEFGIYFDKLLKDYEKKVKK